MIEKRNHLEISTISEHLLFSTVRVETKDLNDSYVGTCFVFEHKSELFLVTAKHNIKDILSGFLIFTEAADGEALIGNRCTIPINNFEKGGLHIHSRVYSSSQKTKV